MTKPRDANDILRDDGPDALRTAFDSAEPPPESNGYDTSATAEPLPFIDIAAWQDRPVPAREWRVPNRIPDENVTLFGGDGATGKTLCSLQLCVAHIRGLDWLNAVVEPGAVMFFSGEETDKELHRRLDVILADRGLKYTDIAGSFFAHCRPAEDPTLGYVDRAGIIRPTPLFARLEQSVGDLKPKLLCIEAAGDVFGGDENKRPQVRQFVGMLRGLAIRAHLAVVMLYHPSLSGLTSGSGMSGSTHWNNACRSRMYLSYVKSDDDAEPDRDLRKLEIMKANYAQSGEIVKLRWKAGIFRVEKSLSSLEQLARSASVDDIFLRLLDLLTNQNQDVSPLAGRSYAPAIFAKHPIGADIKSGAFADAMQRLLDTNRIHIGTTDGPPSKRTKRLVAGGKIL